MAFTPQCSPAMTHYSSSEHYKVVIITITTIIINEICRAQNSQMQQMHQVSCCTITVILLIYLPWRDGRLSWPEHHELKVLHYLVKS